MKRTQPESSNSKRTENRTTNTRRGVLRTLGVAAAAGASLPGLASARSNDNLSVPEAMQAEKEIIEQLPGIELRQTTDGLQPVITDSSKVSPPTEREKKQAKKRRANLHAEQQKQLHESYLAGGEAIDGVTTQSHSTLELGNDEPFFYPDRGDYGGSFSGVLPALAGSHYDLSKDRASASIVASGTAVGSATMWGWIGRKIDVTGSGSQTANVIANGSVNGFLSRVTPGATAWAKARLVVFDQTTGGTRYDEQIAYYSNEFWSTVDEEFSSGMQMLFEAGHEYILAIELEAFVEVISIGFEAGSDFGPQDGDGDAYQGAYFDSFDVRF